MAVTKRFSRTPLQVVAEPWVLDEIAAIADREGVSKASVVRDCLTAALPARAGREVLTLDIPAVETCHQPVVLSREPSEGAS